MSCHCGRTIVARAKDAGGSITCKCGNAIQVPRLSELRQLAGADPFVTNPVETIRKLQAQGSEPAGKTCLLCGSSTPVFYVCNAQCESSHVKITGGDDMNIFIRVLCVLFLPAVLAFALLLRGRAPKVAERRGHDVEVSFHLPVCRPCTGTLGKITPARARKLMGKVPVLKELLEYYPRMKLRVTRG